MALPPVRVTSAAVAFTWSAERAVQTTAAPSSAKRKLSARPMPFEAPVIKATLPSNSLMAIAP
jgi:hypothetical protein